MREIDSSISTSLDSSCGDISIESDVHGYDWGVEVDWKMNGIFWFEPKIGD